MDELKNEEKDNNCSVTASIGIVEINEKLNMEQVIEKADEVLYRSKENGRNRVTVGMPE
jgi:diguanylate cyclase (GGDEF)-like protein